MKHFLKISFACVITALCAIACSNEPKWNLEGEITGAKDGTVLLEAVNEVGYWYTVDTLKIDSDGEFEIGRQPGKYPEIFRLNYGGRYIYFPIDSLDELTLTANASSFDTGYTLSGSQNASRMMKADMLINDFMAGHKAADLDTAANLKRQLSEIAMDDPSSIVAYYIVNKQVNGHPLFRTEVRRELAMIGAVANAYNELRPDDPRTKFMATKWLANKPRNTNPTDTIVANEISIIDITLPDNNGKTQSLRKIAGENKIVILNFTNYKADFSQALNLQFRDLYNAHHANGLEIYQIGFDNSEFDWRMAADNQPWITVFNGNTDEYLMKYNVGALPAIFLLKNGEIVERVTEMDKLKSSVQRLL